MIKILYDIMSALCLITYKPNIIWCNFLNNFKNYKIFIIVDDNNFDLRYFIHNYKNITFLKVSEDKCKMSGYIDTNFTLHKLISGWDKALYYFGVEDKNYDFIWFMEDDVFFYDENTLLEIDIKNVDYDLLSKHYGVNSNGEKKTWLWGKIHIHYSPPYYSGMMCIVRFSRNMLTCLNEYAKENKTLFFLEALFPTIAAKNSLKCSSPSEFDNVYYRHNFKKRILDKKELYHPIKNINTHDILRKELLKQTEMPIKNSEQITEQQMTEQQMTEEQIAKILYLGLLKKQNTRNKKIIRMIIR